MYWRCSLHGLRSRNRLDRLNSLDRLRRWHRNRSGLGLRDRNRLRRLRSSDRLNGRRHLRRLRCLNWLNRLSRDVLWHLSRLNRCLSWCRHRLRILNWLRCLDCLRLGIL